MSASKPPSLSEVVAALLREVDAALAAGRTLPSGTRLEADRVTLTLQLRIEPPINESESPGIQVVVGSVDPENGGHFHSVSFEFRRESSKDLAAVPILQSKSGTSNPATRLEGPAADTAAARLAELLGPPGFDSAARASVLCEAWTGLDQNQVVASVDGLMKAPSNLEDPAVQRARHLMAGIVKSGPVHSLQGGATILGELLRDYPAAGLIDLVQRKWKSQDDWLG